MNSVCFLLALLPPAFAVDCSVEADGIYEMGCRAFVTCTNKVAHITECPGNHVYNSNTQACADPNTFKSLCSKSKDCSVLKDAKFADTADGCKTYYTCNGGTFFGHNYCPGGLVFNEVLQACDWPSDVDPPCGTKGLSTPAGR